jgi:dienelactone hydrolase
MEAPTPVRGASRRRRCATVALAGLLATVALAAGCTRPPGGGNPPGGGAPAPPGQYQVVRETDPRFPTRTIYRPADLSGDVRLPIIVWGQGGCMLAGDRYDPFQREIASHGYLIVANNLPGRSAATTSQMLRESIGLAIGENGRAGSKYFGKLDTTKVAAMGQSCGGLEALDIGDDPRLTTVVAWNSGIFPTGGLGGATKEDLFELHTPTMWVNGGPSDVAYAQAEGDFRDTRVPSVWANLDVGHGGTFGQARGGEFARIGVVWLDWHLKGKTANRSELVGTSCGFCGQRGWRVQSKNWG